jgi:hypothetical protein
MMLSTDLWHGLAVAVVLVWLTQPLIKRVVRFEGDPRLGRLLRWSLVLKLGTVPAQLYLLDTYYRTGDANYYFHAGAGFAHQLHQGNFVYHGAIVNDGIVAIVAGAAFLLTGVTKAGGFFIFSWIGFIGLVLFYRAFRLALPEGDGLRYGRLVLLLPSLLFWSSAIGKDALMTFTLGLAAYGTANVLAQRRGGLLSLAVGLGAAAVIRPHVALLFFFALAIVLLVRRSRRRRSPIVKVVGLAALVIGGLLLVQQTEHWLHLKTIDAKTVNKVLEKNQKNLAPIQGYEGYGSSFDASGFNSPAGFPSAFVTVMFRPFPFEVHNGPQAAAAAEGVFLLALVVTSRRRLLSVFRIRANAYAFGALLFSLGFVYLFASSSNFGIINRERIQLLPLFLVFLSLPQKARHSTPGTASPYKRNRLRSSKTLTRGAERVSPRGGAPRG